MKCIVYTRHNDGGVSVCHPTAEVMTWMSCGGIWNNRPRGFMDIQIERMIADGRAPDAARRFAHAVQFGGCTTAEAYEIIRDRDCAHLGRQIELWDLSELPTDRWFRDAWRRSANGGPISINLKLARPIQWQRVISAVGTENAKRRNAFEPMPLIEIDRDLLRKNILAARDEDELRAIWPKELN